MENLLKTKITEFIKAKLFLIRFIPRWNKLLTLLTWCASKGSLDPQLIYSIFGDKVRDKMSEISYEIQNCVV